MPKPKELLNGFAPASAAEMAGLSVHMLNYLAREGYLVPTYTAGGQRGRVRYYSFRDLVVARLIKRLLDSGLEISRLKTGIKRLASEAQWMSTSPEAKARMLATDGRDLFFIEPGGIIADLTKGGQLAFAFVLDVQTAQNEVRSALDEEQLAHFSMKNFALKPRPVPSAST